jgi:hypothetical protein
MSGIRGRFIWYETLTTDVEGAKAFYGNLIGWGIQTWTDLGEPYHMWTVGEQPIGGLMKMPDGAEAPPHWLGYIGTPDCAATTARAEELGAKVYVKNMEIPTVGTMSVLQDPQGAFFAAFTPATPGEPGSDPPGVGRIDWHELATTDVDAAFAFYSDLFGWEKMEAHDMGHMGIYQEYGVGGFPLGGLYQKPADMPAPPHFLYYIRVEDLEDALGRIVPNGGTVVMEPTEVPGGDRVAVGLDPQGAAFALHWKRESRR